MTVDVPPVVVVDDAVVALAETAASADAAAPDDEPDVSLFDVVVVEVSAALVTAAATCLLAGLACLPAEVSDDVSPALVVLVETDFLSVSVLACLLLLCLAFEVFVVLVALPAAEVLLALESLLELAAAELVEPEPLEPLEPVLPPEPDPLSEPDPPLEPELELPPPLPESLLEPESVFFGECLCDLCVDEPELLLECAELELDAELDESDDGLALAMAAPLSNAAPTPTVVAPAVSQVVTFMGRCCLRCRARAMLCSLWL